MTSHTADLAAHVKCRAHSDSCSQHLRSLLGTAWLHGDSGTADCLAGGAAYLVVMSRSLAATCAAVTSLLWLVALRYGAFQRRSQRLFQDALADTGQVAEEVGVSHAPAVSPAVHRGAPLQPATAAVPPPCQPGQLGPNPARNATELVHPRKRPWKPQFNPLQVFTLSRTVRTFGTERREGQRYSSWLKRLTHLSVRQAAAYLMYLTTNSGLYYLTKARAASAAADSACNSSALCKLDAGRLCNYCPCRAKHNMSSCPLSS